MFNYPRCQEAPEDKRLLAKRLKERDRHCVRARRERIGAPLYRTSAPEGHCHSLENKRNMIRDYGMFWSSVVEAASPLSHLPIWSSPLFLSSSFAASFPLIPAFHASLTVLPRNICHTSIFNPFLPSALPFRLPNSCFHFLLLIPPLLPSLTSSRCLCVRINSPRKRRNSTEAPKRMAPCRQLERSRTPSCCWIPNKTPTKQKRIKTKPRSCWSASRPWRYYSTTTLSLFSPALNFSASFSLCLPSFCFVSRYVFASTLRATPGYPLWPARLPVVRVLFSVVSESMTAHQILRSPSFGEQSHPMRIAAGASGYTPALVCFPLRLGISAVLCHRAPSSSQSRSSATAIHAVCFSHRSHWTHILSDLFNN